MATPEEPTLPVISGEFDLLTVSKPSLVRDFSARRIDVRPSAAGTTIEDGVVTGLGHTKATIGVFAVEVALRRLNVTNGYRAIGIQLGYQQQRADRFLIEHCNIHAIGRLPRTNHDHGIYVEQASNGLVRATNIEDCADRGIQFYPGAYDNTCERVNVDWCGQGVIFSGGNEGLGYQYSRGNVFRYGTISNSRTRYLVESNDAQANAGNIVEYTVLMKSARGRAVQPGIVGVTVRNCIEA